jgi:hypothetical protein
MAKGLLVVQSSPAGPDREDEYNKWYDETHIPQILTIPGVVSARRYRLHDGFPTAPSTRGYLAIYEIEADDLAAPMKELGARSADGRSTTTDAVQADPPAVVALYELME